MSGAPAEVGSTANQYQVLARLATGGMAEIFLARGVSSAGVERYCVLKRILRDRANDVHFVRMFLDEARLAAQLNHANVAQVYDIGKLGDSYFFTMEYVHGETVRALLQRARSLRRELPTAAVLTVIGGAAAGLHHAHDRIGLDGRPLGIVHRDVSPSNLMVGFEGGVKVVDFGVAKAADRVHETRSGTVKGKISYLSPEQCRGRAVDRRSDLFALGIVMWEMLTTERLYRRASDFENMSAIVNDTVPAPSSRRKLVPPELDAIALRLLAKDPEARFQTAEEVVEALEAAAVQTGAMISSAGLGRLVREMFGQRPEPWIELDHDPLPVEGVTVTSEPIPVELGVAELDVDVQLADLPDLGSARVGDPIGPTTPMRPSRTHTLTPPDSAHALPLPAPPLSDAHVIGRPAGPLGLPPSVPAIADVSATPAQPDGAGSRSVRLAGPGPRAAPRDREPVARSARIDPITPTPTPAPPRRWPMIVVIGAAAAIGSLAVWLAMPMPGEPSARVEPAPNVVVIQPLDAAERAADPPAAPAIATDAAAAPSDDTGSVDPGRPALDADPGSAAEPARVIQAAVDDRRYADAVAACSRKLTAETAAACTLAACHERLVAKARSWSAKVTTGRARLIGACRDLGVELGPLRPKPAAVDAGVPDPCEVDPMACQH